MTSGFYTTSGRYTLGTFTATSRKLTIGDETVYAFYCAELLAYVGNTWNATKGVWVANGVSAEGVSFTCAGGERLYASATSQTTEDSVVAGQFAEVSFAASGAGSIVRTTGKLYGSRYALVGSTLVFSSTPKTGYIVSRTDATSGGTLVATSVSTTLSFTLTDDTAVISYFVPAAYKISRTLTSQGVVKYYLNGTEITDDFDANGQHSVSKGDVVRISVTPMGAYEFSYLRIDDERRYATTAAATQEFTLTIAERTSDAVYDIQPVFAAKANYTAYLSVENGTLGTVSVKESDGTSVAVSDGSFQTRYGTSYRLTATVSNPTTNIFDGWYDSTGARVADAETATYDFTQSSVQRSFVAKFAARQTVAVSFQTGTSATTYGSEDAAYVAGCRVTATHPTVVGDKYLSGTWTFTPTAATGWAFVSLYVEDLDVTGHGGVYTASSDGKVSVYLSFSARVIALFRNTADPEEPADVDQGNAAKATGDNAKGIWAWRLGDGLKTMTWRSKRYVGNIPMNWSALCIYANDYTAPVSVKVDGFQSPDETDGKSVTLKAKSQSGCRIPLRRAEKYTELEVSAATTVTHVAVATSMVGLAGGAA